MRSFNLIASCVAACAVVCGAADSNLTEAHTSKQLLPSNFQPPQVFKNTNLVRTINLEKEYPRETISVVVENVDKQEQQEYYIPFEASVISRIGGLEVRDKHNADKGFCDVEIVEFDAER